MKTTNVRAHRRVTHTGKPTSVRAHSRCVEGTSPGGLQKAVVTHGHIHKHERHGTFVHRHPGGGIRHEHADRNLHSYFPASAFKPYTLLDEDAPEEPEDG